MDVLSEVNRRSLVAGREGVAQQGQHVGAQGRLLVERSVDQVEHVRSEKVLHLTSERTGHAHERVRASRHQANWRQRQGPLGWWLDTSAGWCTDRSGRARTGLVGRGGYGRQSAERSVSRTRVADWRRCCTART